MLTKIMLGFRLIYCVKIRFHNLNSRFYGSELYCLYRLFSDCNFTYVLIPIWSVPISESLLVPICSDIGVVCYLDRNSDNISITY